MSKKTNVVRVPVFPAGSVASKTDGVLTFCQFRQDTEREVRIQRNR